MEQKTTMELSRHFRISSRSHHGVVFVAHLAQATHGKPVSIREVAHTMHLSEKYLEELVRALRDAGIVVSSRGRSGGYRLAKPADTITMAEVISALDGPVVLAHCQDPHASTPCPKEGMCASRPFFARLKGVIEQELETTTVADLA